MSEPLKSVISSAFERKSTSWHESRNEEKPGEEKSRRIPIVEAELKILSRSEAFECLGTIGKCDSGLGYAFLEMDVSRRNLSDVSVIPMFRNVLRVNVSENHLTMESLRVLTSMSFLLMLEADRNDLAGSPNMEPMPYLQVLTLNENILKDTEGICHPFLETLELNYNQIEQVSLRVDILKRLKNLELRGNILSSTHGIHCPSLVSLYLADNRIDRLENLEHLSNLKILHLRGNRIVNLDGFQRGPSKLKYLNLRNNKIKKISELKKLENIKGLEVLVILENPLNARMAFDEERGDFDSLRIKFFIVIPCLKRINKNSVLKDEVNEALKIRRQMLEDGVDFSELDSEVDSIEGLE